MRSQHVLPTLRLAIAGVGRREPDRFRIIQYSVQYDHIHLLVEALNGQALSSGMSSVAIRIARSVNTLVGRRGRFWADRWHGRALTSPRQVRTALVYVLANFRKHARRRLGPGIDPFSSGAWFDGWEGLRVVNGSGVVNDPGQLEAGVERAPPVRDVVDERVSGDALAVIRHSNLEASRGAAQGSDSGTRRASVRDGKPDAVENAGRGALGGSRGQPLQGGAHWPLSEVPVTRPRTWLARVGWRRYGTLRLDEAPRGAP